MDRIEKALDEVEINIQKLPEEDAYKTFLVDELSSLRVEFEAKQDSDPYFESKIRDMQSRVFLYIQGEINNPTTDKKEIAPKIEVYPEGKSSANENLSINPNASFQKEKNDIKILIEYAKMIDFNSSIEKVEQAIQMIEQNYEIMKIYSQGMEQVIASLKYRMMLKLLKENQHERAREYCKAFSTDMRICIVDRLKDELDELIKKGALEEASRLNAYIYNNAMSENDLNLWELITRIEMPELDYRLPGEPQAQLTEPINNMPVTKEKRSHFSELVEKINDNKKKREEKKAKRKAIRQEEKEKNIKIYTIKYDPKNEPTCIDMQSMKQMYKSLYNSWIKQGKSKVKIIFEEGIKQITFPEIKIELLGWRPRWQQEKEGKYRIPDFADVVEVSIPSTAESIGDNAFWNFGKLKSLDISHTNIKLIGESAFAFCICLHDVYFPNCLEKIKHHAFANSGVRTVNLRETKVKEIDVCTFENCCYLSDILLSTCLERIKDFAFENSWLKEINARRTNLVSIGKGAFFESSLKKAFFPDCLKEIREKAFAYSLLQELDIRNTQVNELSKELLQGCSHLIQIGFSDINKIGERCFDGIPIHIQALQAFLNRKNIPIKNKKVSFSGYLMGREEEAYLRGEEVVDTDNWEIN